MGETQTAAEQAIGDFAQGGEEEVGGFLDHLDEVRRDLGLL